jgi:hypothetical protein
MKKCEDCIEWEYFEGYGYGCFCMKTTTPIDAKKCKFYAEKNLTHPVHRNCQKPQKNKD